MTRREELDDIFKHIDETEKQLINPLLDEVVSLENKMKELKQYPFISVHPKNPNLQKSTIASRLYKECSQSYMNAMRILINVIRKTESSETNKLLEALKEFE